MSNNLLSRWLDGVRKHPWISALLLVFVMEFVWLALFPHSREDWMLENLLVLVFLILLVRFHKKYHLSMLSWFLILIFLCLHEVGAHHTYAKVPYDPFFESVFGFRLNDLMGWERNHFDRLAHFAYGLLIVLPWQEICSQISRSKSGWTYFVAVNIVMSTSMLFELLEWAAALMFSGELGIAYLGTQGDVWDAQKDMFLAIVGALLALFIRWLWIRLSRLRK